MLQKRFMSVELWVVATLFICVPLARSSPKYKVLHAFGTGTDGAGLWGSLLLDQPGNVYGTTSDGGSKGGGTVFKLTPKANGHWAFSILHDFDSADGGGSTAGLIFDPAGKLFGTTRLGGGPFTTGTVFELIPASEGWTFTVIHRFGEKDPAYGPYGGVVMDQGGNLYGVGGWAFKLSPSSDGWKEALLHAFACQHGDGCGVLDHPILDAAGNLYGTTELGGGSKDCGGGCGTVYQLHPLFGGKWKETIIHSFGSFKGDGIGPGVGALTIDGSGTLYGTTDVGGPNGYGTVFKLTPGSDGRWKETILHSFTQGADGDHVSAGVVMDKAGNLYGTTISGGTQCDCGVVYKLAPGTNGRWTYTVLHRFTGYDGAQPDANLILDNKGNLYGTTATGGAGGAGVAFEVTP
jgi:uncharacterized repeat protein (TIGR03803 family)